MKDYRKVSEKIKFNPTKEQRKHIESIHWLFSESEVNRRSGRSLLLAYVYIIEALGGRKIIIIDHAFITTGAGYMANKILARYIGDIIRENKLPLKINWTTLTLQKI